MNKLVNIDFNLTMSSREIAVLTGKRHPDVARDIGVMFDQLGEDMSSFARIYKDSMNRSQIEYLLDKNLTLTLVSGYSTILRHAIIKRWQELEANLLKEAEEERQRVRARQQARLENPEMTQAIKDMRTAQGKDDLFYVYSNENDMINKIAIGMTATKFRKEKGLSKK